MTPLRRFAISSFPLLLAGACAQLIGLSDYEKGDVTSGGGGGDGNTSSGGARVTGGEGGAGDSSGGMAGVSTGGTSQGGTAGDGGAGGEPGGDGGQGGTDPTGGKGGTAGGVGGMPGGFGGSGGSPPCIEITVASDIKDIIIDNYDFPHVVAYAFDIEPELGGAVGDTLEVQFWNWDGGSFDGVATGVFPLSIGRDSNSSTCSRCIYLYRDDGAAAGLQKTFFQTSGTLTVGSTSQQMDGYPTLSYSDVTLREVTIDPNDGHSTVVPGGLCVHVETAAFSRTPAWSCDPAYQTDGDCDCGCTVPDPTCPDGNASSCDFCWCNQSDTACPGYEHATNNWTCL